MYPETYRVNITNTDPERPDIEIDPLIYEFENGNYFDKLDEILHDELIYMESDETMTITIARIH